MGYCGFRAEAAWTMRRLRFFAVVAGFAVLFLGPAIAKELSPRLEVARDGSSLLIAFDSRPTATTLATLAVELDETDVTRTLTVSPEGGLAIAPAGGLSPGDHDLRLYQLTPDRRGFSLLEAWQFTVAGSEGWRLDSASIEAAHQVSAHVRGHREWAAAQSAGSLAASASNGRWTAEANTSYLATSQRRAYLDEVPADLGDYRAEIRHDGDHADFGFVAGHQTISADPLLVSDLTRRGVSIEMTDDKRRYGVHAFGLRSEASSSASNISGIGRTDESIFGGSLMARPIDASWGQVETGITAYSGRGATLAGTATGDADGLAGVLRLSTADRRLSLEAGAARSRADLDGSGTVLGRRDDEAYTSTLHFVVIPPSPGDMSSLTWSAGYKWIGTDFFSFANPFLTVDVEEVATGLDYASPALNLSAEVAHRTDNTGDNPALPRDEAIIGEIAGAYFPYSAGEAPDWLGQLALNFGVQAGTTDRIARPAGSIDVDALTTQIYAGVSASRSDLSWGFTGAYTSFEDEVSGSSDQTGIITSAFVTWLPHERFSLSGLAQWQHTSITGTGRADDVTAQAEATYWFVPDTWSLAVGHEAAFSSEAMGYEGWETFLELNWYRRNGHSLALRGGSAGGDAMAGRDLDAPELFAGLFYRVATDFRR